MERHLSKSEAEISNDKMAAIDALIELIGWRAIVHMVAEPRVITLQLGPHPDAVTFNLRDDWQPSLAPWYWKPALYDALHIGGHQWKDT